MKQNKIKREYLTRLPQYIEDEIIKKNSHETIQPIAKANFDPKIKQKIRDAQLFNQERGKDHVKLVSQLQNTYLTHQKSVSDSLKYR